MKQNASFVLLVVLVALVMLPAMGAAQDGRSSTGRHKPVPKAIPDAESSARKDRTKPGQLHVGIFVGTSKGSGLFRASTVSGSSVPWSTIGEGSFNSSRFSTKFHNNLISGLLVRYVYAPGVNNGAAIRLGLDYTHFDIVAQTITGQVGSLELYDRASTINVALGWEYPLADIASYPFVGAEILAGFSNPTMNTELQQTNVGGRVIFGYHFRFQEKLGLRLEGRISRTVWDAGDFIPNTTLDNQPLVDLSAEDHVTYFDVLVGVEIKL